MGKPFGFCGPTYQSRDGLWAYARSVNLFPSADRAAEGAKSKAALLGVPGLEEFSTITDAPVRGLWAGDERLFAVGDTTVYEIDSSGTETAIPGSIASATTPVQMCGNGNSLLVVSGDKGYLAEAPAGAPGTGTVTPINDFDMVSATYLDGYFVALEKDTNNVRISGLLDGGTWDALDVEEYRSSGSIDRLMRVIAHKGMLWLFGRKTTGLWAHTGNADYPFQRLSGASLDTGTDAAWSVASDGTSLMWLGSDERGVGVVYRSTGGTPERVSTSAIEYLIQGMHQANTPGLGMTDAYGYCYQEDGHTFYVLTFTTGGLTLVYDRTTGWWHERLRWSGSAWLPWRGGGQYAFCFGKHLVANMGYSSSGVIYRQGLDLSDDDGDDIRYLRIGPYVHDGEHQRVFHHHLRLHLKGTPSVSLSYSDNEGTTWSASKVKTAANRRVDFWRLGNSRERLYSVQIDSDQPMAIAEAYLDASGGTT
jgi:hypothetical protein